MRRRLVHFGAIIVLMLCIWGHVSELFDHWDNTFQTGKDIEYSTVIVALAAGAVLAFAHLSAAAIRRITAVPRLLLLVPADFPCLPPSYISGGCSPPPPLRI